MKLQHRVLRKKITALIYKPKYFMATVYRQLLMRLNTAILLKKIKVILLS